MVRAATVSIAAGDALVLATDGVDGSVLGEIGRATSPQANADRIMAAGRKGIDDALVLVARFRGDTS